MGWRGCMSRQESDSRERERVCVEVIWVRIVVGAWAMIH